ncbi:MAG TPA: hypothetical protein VFJ19_07295 [Nocardioidaceae bacterium]|nr:hypothetical protein [Nocardioidaceae bacterium]
MSKLSELKSSPDVGLAEYPADVCVSTKLAAELEAADKALFEAEQKVIDLRAALEEAQQVDEDAPRRPRRSGESPNADLKRRLKEAEEQAEAAARASDEIRERMQQHTVRLTLQGKPSGEWRLWVAEHPPRDEDDDPAGFARDVRHAGVGAGSGVKPFAFCDIDALVNDLHLWISKYDGEPASDEWWEFVSVNGAPAHLRNAASMVVRMHEQVVDLGKSRLAWRADRRSASNSK